MLNPPPLTTKQLAAQLGVEAQTIRASLCRNGSYFGLQPATKLPNRLLLWPADSVERIVNRANTPAELDGGLK